MCTTANLTIVLFVIDLRCSVTLLELCSNTTIDCVFVKSVEPKYGTDGNKKNTGFTICG